MNEKPLPSVGGGTAGNEFTSRQRKNNRRFLQLQPRNIFFGKWMGRVRTVYCFPFRNSAPRSLSSSRALACDKQTAFPWNCTRFQGSIFSVFLFNLSLFLFLFLLFFVALFLAFPLLIDRLSTFYLFFFFFGQEGRGGRGPRVHNKRHVVGKSTYVLPRSKQKQRKKTFDNLDK